MSLGNVCKHRSIERSGVKCFHCTHVFDLTNLKGEKRRNVGKLNNELNIVNQLVDLHFLLFVNITGNWKNLLAHTRQIIIADWLSLSESSWRIFITGQGSPHIVKAGRLDFSLSWLKGEVRENLGDFRKSIQIFSPLPHVPLPLTKTILKGCN
jgi:hypothetical protein